jgi:hypothetical protein
MTQDNEVVVQRNCLDGAVDSPAITEYEVILRPPVDCGAAQVMVADVVVVAMMPRVGAAGADGIVYVDTEAIDAPTVLLARAVMSTDTPDCNPVIVHVRAKRVAGTHEPTELLMLNDNNGDPPSVAGADQETRAVLELTASTWSERGAEGSASGITRAEAVLLLVSALAVLVTVTIFVSYIRDGSRFVKRAL